MQIYAYHAEDDGKNIWKEPVIALGCYYDEEWGTNETIPLVVAEDGLCSPLDMPNFLRIASEDDLTKGDLSAYIEMVARRKKATE